VISLHIAVSPAVEKGRLFLVS